MTATLPDIDLAHKQLRKHITKTAAYHLYRYGQCGGQRKLADVRSEANELFVEAYRSYKPERGELRRWVTFYIRRRLIETVRTIRRRQEISRVYDRGSITRNRTPVKRSREDFIPHAGDGRFVATLALDRPVEVDALLTDPDSPTPAAIRTAVRTHLTNLGWDRGRIAAAFAAVRKELS